MGRMKKRRELTAFGRLRAAYQSTKLIEWSAARVEWDELVLVDGFVGGLWAGGPANGSAQRSEHQQTTPTNSIQHNNS